MIFVLPILLYPLLGIGVLKFAASLEEKRRRPSSWSGRRTYRKPPDC